ncbi:hypothetical protein pb186bvf_019824 [Paramecium bursaria]
MDKGLVKSQLTKFIVSRQLQIQKFYNQNAIYVVQVLITLRLSSISNIVRKFKYNVITDLQLVQQKKIFQQSQLAVFLDITNLVVIDEIIFLILLPIDISIINANQL